jgi:hypothetical protein
LDESQIMTKLDEFIARQEVSTKNSLGKINASGRTILHAILGDAQQKRFEEQLRFLFKWCMDEHPELYRSKYTGDNNEAKTVLHLALRPVPQPKPTAKEILFCTLRHNMCRNTIPKKLNRS